MPFWVCISATFFPECSQAPTSTLLSDLQLLSMALKDEARLQRYCNGAFLLKASSTRHKHPGTNIQELPHHVRTQQTQMRSLSPTPVERMAVHGLLLSLCVASGPYLLHSAGRSSPEACPGSCQDATMMCHHNKMSP